MRQLTLECSPQKLESARHPTSDEVLADAALAFDAGDELRSRTETTRWASSSR